MMKQIMKRAWEIYRTLEGDRLAKLSMALRQAWAEAKAAKVSPKQQIIDRLNEIVANSAILAGCELIVNANDWQNYGKDRTYFAIVERSTGRASCHYKEKKYGYIDNITGEYFPAKYGDARENYTFSGMAF